jgi:uridine kinase
MNLIIGLCGPSGSGKTTLAKMLAEEYKANIISLDNYFLLDPPYKKYAHNGKNWELPENVDWDAVSKVVEEIRATEQPVSIRKINWNSNTYSESVIIPSLVTIIEGFLLLHDDELVEQLDLAVYIDVPDKVGLERRMKREGTSKNKKWIEEVTFPEYAPRREAFRQKADLVLNGEDELETNFEILRTHIQSLQN